MNVHDFPQEFTEEHVPKMFEYIFNRQKELMEKYREIESKNGFHYPEDLKVNLDDRFDQNLLKNMAWRVIEEIGESLEAYDNKDDDPIHSKEELADGLHFLTELLILSGLTHKDISIESPIKIAYIGIPPFDAIKSKDDILKEKVAIVVKTLGTSMNCLKLKPWKQTQVKTDLEKLKIKLIEAYDSYLQLMFRLMEPVEVLNLYFSKSDVNKFRIRSKY